MKVYLDSNHICHAEPQEGYVEAEHDYFDNIAPMAFPYYRYIPEHNFIQCMDSQCADVINKQYEIDNLTAALIRLGVEI